MIRLRAHLVHTPLMPAKVLAPRPSLTTQRANRPNFRRAPLDFDATAVRDFIIVETGCQEALLVSRLRAGISPFRRNLRRPNQATVTGTMNGACSSLHSTTGIASGISSRCSGRKRRTCRPFRGVAT